MAPATRGCDVSPKATWGARRLAHIRGVVIRQVDSAPVRVSAPGGGTNMTQRSTGSIMRAENDARCPKSHAAWQLTEHSDPKQ